MRNYTEEEENYLRDNFLKYTNKELAEKFDRSVDGIAQKLKEMDLIRRPINPYSDAEKKYIKDNLGKKTISEIAKDLDRTQGGISKYISKYRVSKIRKKSKIYLENIDNDILPFFSKSDNYFEILSNMKAGDSFEFPETDNAVVSNQKYILINSLKKEGRNPPLFIIRKTEKKDDILYKRIWRIQ